LIAEIDKYRDKIMTKDEDYEGKGSDYYVKDSTDILLEKLEQLQKDGKDQPVEKSAENKPEIAE